MSELWCLGCGRYMGSAPEEATMMMSCACGAESPPLTDQDGRVVRLPTSMTLCILQGKPLPHLEYYLGFSGHESPAKKEMRESLERLGSVSVTQCQDPGCRAAYLARREKRGKG